MNGEKGEEKDKSVLGASKRKRQDVRPLEKLNPRASSVRWDVETTDTHAIGAAEAGDYCEPSAQTTGSAEFGPGSIPGRKRITNLKRGGKQSQMGLNAKTNFKKLRDKEYPM